MSADSGDRQTLTADERARLDAIRAAETLADLLAVVDAGDVEEAYLETKPVWKELRGREVDPPARVETDEGVGLPGDRIDLDGTTVWVHGITHADTDEERAFLRSHVSDILEQGGAVYCEQGIRGMYFGDVEAVNETDDYRWALAQSQTLDVESRVAAAVDRKGDDGSKDANESQVGGESKGANESQVGGESKGANESRVSGESKGANESRVSGEWQGGDASQAEADERRADNADAEGGIGLDLQSLASQFREATFSLIDSGSEVYGDRFARVLGDVASDFLLSHEDLATGEDYEAFSRLNAASTDPAELPALQQYYRCAFLPQPLEREWLRRHDRELELFTHARNERIAAYVLADRDDAAPVHVITGAAHQPGVTYYLERYRDGEWDFRPFEALS